MKLIKFPKGVWVNPEKVEAVRSQLGNAFTVIKFVSGETIGIDLPVETVVGLLDGSHQYLPKK